MEENQFVNKFVDVLFTKNNIKYLIILFILAFVLRSIAAVNISPNADEMVHGTHALGIINSNKLQIMDQDAVWFYLTDLFYNIFGKNLFGLRFMSILFGSLSMIIVYLIGKELFSKRVALIASFILAFSPYHIRMTLAEMDTSMMFFVLLSMYFLIKALKEQKNPFYYLSFLFLGIGIMIKQIALLFLPAFLLFVLYYKLKNKELNLKFKHLIYFALIIFITVIPILTFNYLLYKDKGLVDLQFSRFLGISKETYSSIEATLKPFKINDLFFSYEGHPPGLYEGIGIIYQYEPLILFLGILGIIYILFTNRYILVSVIISFLILFILALLLPPTKQILFLYLLIIITIWPIISLLIKKEFSLLLSLSFLFPFIFLSGTSLLPIHFVFAPPLLSLLAANFLDFLVVKIQKIKLKSEVITFILLTLMLILSLFSLNSNGVFAGKNEITKLISYKNYNIDKNSLVIVDSRIYRGRIALLFNDRHYLEASYLNELIQKQQDLPGLEAPLKTYFIECITDDCGWGTINNQPEFNNSMEDILMFFKNNSKYLTTIKNSYKEDYFNVYNTNLNLKQSSLDLVDSTHLWFYYPLRYKGESFDDYQAKGINKFFDVLAHWILYLEALITLSTPILLIYLLFKDENEVKHNNSSIQ